MPSFCVGISDLLDLRFPAPALVSDITYRHLRLLIMTKLEKLGSNCFCA